jgi:hypothetical protein
MLMENLHKRGGKGMPPTCCFPLWGREGVSLLAAAWNKRITQKKEDFNKALDSIKTPAPADRNYQPE